ncbi:Hypothetical protein Ccan_04340 [Capnocytophaga canimorsus Cc5]|uniref:Uncharacterized protein n=1 Tax=Capnocytophaga canimorsus (strain 5) TaxID=860228 RepID=F9YRS7_CAPCC|nr:Hypothetical protein Ccan_04340 [Capnocytophaga canimorsus Cc5]
MPRFITYIIQQKNMKITEHIAKAKGQTQRRFLGSELSR